MPRTPRTLRIALCAAACLFASSAARADSITFESVAGLGGGQSGAQSGGQTSKSSQGGQVGQSGGQGGGQGGGGQTGQVLTVDLGDVTGTVCDCGEIAPAGPPGASSSGGNGFPRLPLLAFAAAPAIPCIFTDLCRNNPPPLQPPPPSVPEPLTVITFATGLGTLAALRRRRQHK